MTWRSREDIMLSEISQSLKVRYHMTRFIKRTFKSQTTETEVRKGRGVEVIVHWGQSFSLGRWQSSGDGCHRQLHNNVNTERHWTVHLTQQVLCYVYFTTINKIKKKYAGGDGYDLQSLKEFCPWFIQWGAKWWLHQSDFLREWGYSISKTIRKQALWAPKAQWVWTSKKLRELAFCVYRSKRRREGSWGLS